ncbi:coiled-coil domain-containing protein 66 [Discoglossus pictus]
MSATLGVGAMNLGDGLKLETQILDGKTKLILAPYGAQAKDSRPTGNKARAQRAALKGKQPGQVLRSVQSNLVKTEQPVTKPRSEKDLGKVPSEKTPSNVLKELENKNHGTVIQQSVPPTKQFHGKPKPVAKNTTVSYVPKQRPQKKHGITAEELRESLVCLTQEQFQQILLTINHGSKSNVLDTVTKESEEETVEQLLKTESEPSGTEEHTSASPEKQEELHTVQQTNIQNARQQGHLFSTLGERESDKSLQEAKKAQWRRELDEQIALKKKLKETTQDYAKSRQHETHSTEYNGTTRLPFPDHSKEMYSSDYITPAQDDPLLKTSIGPATTESSPTISCGPSERASSFSSPELPAAIRTAFVLGEVAPLDHPFSAIKRQQQKIWLDELNKQREDVMLRKLQEKQKLLEEEDTDRWAMHFDSFKKQNNTQTQIPNKIVNLQRSEDLLPADEMPNSLTPSTFSTPSYLQRAGSELVKSTEEDNFQGQKSGFLRTMTSLLDPVQIEERDKKRLKQMEHQKAIAAQVEEKRRRKQLEEQQRKCEEQEEEQRLAKEREHMRKQFEEDAFRQKKKEEVLTLKTNELYQTMQRAQEEAHRIKQEQRMRDLAQKGHDISKLQRNLAGDLIQEDFSMAGSRSADILPEDHPIERNYSVNQSIATSVSPRKDTAVQTDVVMNTDFKRNEKAIAWRDLQNSSPDIPVEFKDQQNADVHVKKLMQLREKNKSKKENKNTANDTNDQYARVENQVKENVRKPDWNKNKPNRKYIPASEKYPKGLQKQREESKVKRQMELLHMIEKNNANNVQTKKRTSPERALSPKENTNVSVLHVDTKNRPIIKKEQPFQKTDSSFKRPDSPPVPAVKNRLQQNQKKQNVGTNLQGYNGNSVQGHTYTSKRSEISPESSEQESERPPSSNFIPYVRTKEIYYLDPDAPMSRPSTHDPQYRHEGDDNITRQIFSSDHARDPLLNPGVIKNKDRQQAILKGLSELRKGLLQKQKELETGLIPDV